MLVFPQWRPAFPEPACRVPRWMPAEHFAPYLARPIALPPLPPQQIEDEDSSGGSSPDRTSEGEGGEVWCGWRGCGARCLSVARLSAHVARTHALAHRDGLFYCGWKGCARPQRGFNARYKMLVHVRTHTNERPHTCNQCQKSFSRAENLKIHLRSHSGEKPYVCPYEGCGKAYSNSSDRFKHTRTHTVDKPYCCKVPGCNKRYTDPSSLRKHVKTYKHFATEDTKKESSDEIQDTFSPIRESSYSNIDATSPLHGRIPVGCSPPRPTISPSIPPYNPVLPLAEPTMPSIVYSSSHIPYMTPVEPMYTMRVPSNEMSYLEYTQMYEHAYRNYYSNSVSYPVLRPKIIENIYNYEDNPIVNDVPMEEVQIRYDHKIRYEHEEMPLNLCAKRLECKPIEELVRRTDLPLDLSTKS